MADFPSPPPSSDLDQAALARRALTHADDALARAESATSEQERRRYELLADAASRRALVHAQLDATEVQRGRLEVDQQTLDVLRAERRDRLWQAGAPLRSDDPARPTSRAAAPASRVVTTP